jgi:hypothetical protein
MAKEENEVLVSIDDVVDDVFEKEIFKYLSYRELFVVGLLSRRYRRLARSKAFNLLEECLKGSVFQHGKDLFWLMPILSANVDDKKKFFDSLNRLLISNPLYPIIDRPDILQMMSHFLLDKKSSEDFDKTSMEVVAHSKQIKFLFPELDGEARLEVILLCFLDQEQFFLDTEDIYSRRNIFAYLGKVFSLFVHKIIGKVVNKMLVDLINEGSDDSFKKILRLIRIICWRLGDEFNLDPDEFFNLLLEKLTTNFIYKYTPRELRQIYKVLKKDQIVKIYARIINELNDTRNPNVAKKIVFSLFGFTSFLSADLIYGRYKEIVEERNFNYKEDEARLIMDYLIDLLPEFESDLKCQIYANLLVLSKKVETPTVNDPSLFCRIMFRMENIVSGLSRDQITNLYNKALALFDGTDKLYVQFNILTYLVTSLISKLDEAQGELLYGYIGKFLDKLKNKANVYKNFLVFPEHENFREMLRKLPREQMEKYFALFMEDKPFESQYSSLRKEAFQVFRDLHDLQKVVVDDLRKGVVFFNSAMKFLVEREYSREEIYNYFVKNLDGEALEAPYYRGLELFSIICFSLENGFTFEQLNNIGRVILNIFRTQSHIGIFLLSVSPSCFDYLIRIAEEFFSKCEGENLVNELYFCIFKSPLLQYGVVRNERFANVYSLLMKMLPIDSYKQKIWKLLEEELRLFSHSSIPQADLLILAQFSDQVSVADFYQYVISAMSMQIPFKEKFNLTLAFLPRAVWLGLDDLLLSSHPAERSIEEKIFFDYKKMREEFKKEKLESPRENHSVSSSSNIQPSAQENVSTSVRRNSRSQVSSSSSFWAPDAQSNVESSFVLPRYSSNGSVVWLDQESNTKENGEQSNVQPDEQPKEKENCRVM